MKLKDFLIRNWYIFLLIAIVLLGFWVRSFPARFNELQALDPFYLYRISEHIVYNNFQLPVIDTLRYSPLGTVPYEVEFLTPVYLPAIIYAILGLAAFGVPYLSYAIMFPALMGTLAVLVMYFLGKELMNRKAGLFAAFFLALTPAFITRTSAGFFEKEPIAGVFIILSIFLFIKAFKKGSWVYGIMAGLSLAMLSSGWGGVNFVYLMFGAFFMLLFLMNFIFAILGYMSKSYHKTLESIDNYLGINAIKAYLPMVLLGTLLHQVLPRHADIFSSSVMLLYFTLGVLIIKHVVSKFKAVKEENVPYIIPGVLVLGSLAVLIGSLFSDFFSKFLNSMINITTVSKGVLGSTVAENAPGSWAHIASRTQASPTGFLRFIPSELNILWSLWFFALLGGFVVLYKINKKMTMFLPAAFFWLLSTLSIIYNWGLPYSITFLFLSVLISFVKEPDEKSFIYIFPLLWLFSSIVGTLNFIRLVFLVGPAFAIMGGIFMGWFIDKAFHAGRGFFKDRLIKINPIAIALVVFVVLFIAVNVMAGISFGLQLGPSICFPRTDSNGDVIPCLTINPDSSYVTDSNQPWYQAFNYMSEETPEDSVILSWWDFGYWFQTRAKRASTADGGNLGGKFYINDKLAQWFTSDPSNWSDWVDWLKYHKVTHILMDFTLPGKYGAISRISTDGERTVGMLQFSDQGLIEQDNKTVREFRNGQYTIWLPQEGNTAGTPVFLIQQGDAYSQPTFINDICTGNGLIVTGNQTPSAGGCLALSSIGVYYIPQEAEHTIFTRLMFMDGEGLPVTKVFDNTLIKIYEVIYDWSP